MATVFLLTHNHLPIWAICCQWEIQHTTQFIIHYYTMLETHWNTVRDKTIQMFIEVGLFLE